MEKRIIPLNNAIVFYEFTATDPNPIRERAVMCIILKDVGGIVIDIGTQKICCETVSYPNELPLKIGDKIKQLTIIVTDDDRREKYSIVLEFDILRAGKEKKVSVEIVNNHNGYYSHMVSISAPNYTESFSI